MKLNETTALLERTPGALRAWLIGLPGTWIAKDEGEGTWTVLGVLGHLVYCERVDWMRRVVVVMEHGELRPFEPLDREAFAKELRGSSVEELVDQFAALRAENLKQLQHLKLSAEDLARTGRHPKFGVVTLSQLLATWAAHDLTHMHQISRIMAHQYREAVGPWVEFLGVLQCEGHSGA